MIRPMTCSLNEFLFADVTYANMRTIQRLFNVLRDVKYGLKEVSSVTKDGNKPA